MKLVRFFVDGDPPEMIGWLEDGWVYGAWDALQWAKSDGRRVPHQQFIADDMYSWIGAPPDAREELRHALKNVHPEGVAFPLERVTLLAPVQPRTLRDFYAFEAHVKNARARRGLGMIPEWYEFPAFYFSNPHVIYGPEDEVPKPHSTNMLDFELEVAAVVWGNGSDIPAAKADMFIAGYTIMNDWSARDIQRREMKVGLGPAKGKDFATSLGPWIVTPDELFDRRRAGNRYDLEMVARINGREVSRGNLKDLHFTFEQMIERASADSRILVGDVIGSGTVGTGCLLETEAAPWLEPGDVVELEVERLGILTNKVR